MVLSLSHLTLHCTTYVPIKRLTASILECNLSAHIINNYALYTITSLICSFISPVFFGHFFLEGIKLTNLILLSISHNLQTNEAMFCLALCICIACYVMSMYSCILGYHYSLNRLLIMFSIIAPLLRFFYGHY